MRILGLDTTTEACSVALWQDGEIIRRWALAGRTHSELLRPMVAEVLEAGGLRLRDVDAFACGIGPGSFAGVRIGVAFVQGMACALDRPVVPLCSLELLALQAFGAGFTQVLAAIDARMQEVYVASYLRDADGLPQAIVEPRVCAPVSLVLPAGAERAQVGIGSGWAVYGDALTMTLGIMAPVERRADAFPDIADGMAYAASRLQQGGGRSPAELQPLYLRNKVALTLDEQQKARLNK